ncbi:MAG: alpha/beta fold hydrolase [Lachnospiraceae bacterium]|jgi:pimeloyl-ACP methyl ester carboxylesterase
MEGYVQTNGIRMHYFTEGEGEPLVLLMGLGADGHTWAPHIEAYKNDFCCIAVDNRGAGLSDKPAEVAYTTRQMAKDTIDLLDSLGIEKAHFHGISMGGAIAQWIAIDYPERVKSVILTSTQAAASVGYRRGIELLRDTKGQLPAETSARLLNWIIYANTYQDAHEEVLLEKEAAVDPNPMPVHAFIAQCNACITHNTLDHLSEIKAPVLIAAGEDDQLADSICTKALSAGIPHAEVYICPEGGHVHHWEDLETFNQVTLEFLKKHKEKA